MADPTRPRAGLLTPDNDLEGWASIPEAVASGRAFLVQAAPNLLCVDHDPQDRDPALAEMLRDQLDRAGHPPVLVASGCDGHRHVLARIDDPEERARWRSCARSWGMDDRPSGHIRPPLAPHRWGLPVRLLDPIDPAEALVRLAPPADPTHTSGSGEFDWQRLLATGRWPRGWTGEDRSHSAMVWLICIGAIRAGWSLDRVRAGLADPSNGGGGGYRKRAAEGRNADRWLDDHVWPDAQQAAAERPVTSAAEALAELDRIEAAVGCHSWPGVAGATARRIVLALVDIGREQKTTRPVASYRQLAERALVHRNTVGRAVREGRLAPFVSVAEHGGARTEVQDGEFVEKTYATEWRLRAPASDRARGCATLPGTGGCTPNGTSTRVYARQALDAFRWRGLGHNAPRVIDALLEEGPLTHTELGDRLELNVGNLRARLLPKLERHNLVRRDEAGGWHVVDDLDAALEAAAEALGVAGTAERQRRQHGQDRERFLEHRERTRPERQHRSIAPDPDGASQRFLDRRLASATDNDEEAPRRNVANERTPDGRTAST